MRVSSTAAAVVVVIAVVAQGAAGLGPGAGALLALPQAIVLKGGLIALIVVLKVLKKAKDSRREERRQALHAMRAPNAPHALRILQKRAVATNDNFFLTEALTKGNDVEEAMEEAVWKLMEQLDDDGCLLKLLCHLQEKSQDALTPEEGQLVGLFPAGVPGCGKEFSRCTVKEALLEEAFLYTWQLQNTI